MAEAYKLDGDIAVLTLDNPPVNGLSQKLRAALVSALRAAEADPKVKAVVLVGTGKGFSGGADIREFNTPAAFAEPSLRTLFTTLDTFEKPVVAAIHGSCLGGGFELALSCHYRVATEGAQLGFPEVNLGLIPGAGGTQRFPRLAGLEAAVNLIVSGKPVPAKALAKTPVLAEVVAGEDPLPAALAFARKIADARPLPRARDLKIDYPNHEAFLQCARNTARAMAKSFPAPVAAIDAIAGAVTLGFDEGLAAELAIFFRLMQTSESRSLRHAFFGERAAGKIADVGDDVKPREVKSVGIVGAGTMGGGIAMAFANVGIPVKLLETKPEFLERGLGVIKKNYESSAKKGKLKPEELQKRVGLIQGTLSYDDFKTVDLVIEAVFEDLAVKKEVFAKLDAVLKPGAILATNTSTLDINVIADGTKRPQDVVGLHFFSPANVMKLLEVVRPKKTSKDVLATAMALAKTLKKTGVLAGVCDGFIGNRMLEEYARQAAFLLEEGALPAQVDKAAEDFGFMMGPFRMIDMAGNDIANAIRKRRTKQYPDEPYAKVLQALEDTGRLGQKTGGGWYDYVPGDRKPQPSKLVEELILKNSADQKISRRTIGATEIVERLVFALANSGARILEEGIAQRASDIDMIYLTGYGFPVFRGGPMFYADTVGLLTVLRTIERYRKTTSHGERLWKPAPLLVKLATEGKTFNPDA